MSQTDKALCYFQPMLKAGHTVAHASVGQIRNAANALILECAANPDSPQGGIATNIGMCLKVERRFWNFSRIKDLLSSID